MHLQTVLSLERLVEPLDERELERTLDRCDVDRNATERRLERSLDTATPRIGW